MYVNLDHEIHDLSRILDAPSPDVFSVLDRKSDNLDLSRTYGKNKQAVLLGPKFRYTPTFLVSSHF